MSGQWLVSLWATCWTFCLLFPCLVAPFGFGNRGGDSPLYTDKDKITLVENATFKAVILNSPNAWLVEFYSSWCGHCISFAPTFKELALDVYPWRSVISVAAIDCADEKNMPICREYEVMGYPSIKFFPPKSSPKELGAQREGHIKTVDRIKEDMHAYVVKLMQNESLHEHTKLWPDLESFKSDDLSSLWSSAQAPSSSSPYALLILHQESREFLAADLILDSSEVTSKLKKSPLIVRSVNVDKASPKLKEKLTDSETFPQLLAVSKELEIEVVAVATSTSDPEIRTQFDKAIKNFIWDHSKELSSIGGSGGGDRGSISGEGNKSAEAKSGDNNNKVSGQPAHETHEGEIKRRRYTVYLSDLEKTMLYSLNHEVAQHAVITGDTLNALQDYVDVLVQYFPGRKSTMRLLEELRAWVMSHDDAVKGEDLASEINKLRSEYKALADTPESSWIGCVGSSPQFGGYPCGLWSLFHTLTVNHAEEGHGNEDPKIVLKAMSGFVEHFFGCRDCARHFAQASENGQSIEREVRSPDEAILWLWKMHNRVNIRLSGDLTEDPAFPKEKFPNKQHCSDCYNNKLGSDLTTEFRLKTVEKFLKAMYTDLNYSGLDMEEYTGKVMGAKHVNPKHPPIHHDLIVKEPVNAKESLDKSNYDRAHNESWTVMSKTDASLSFIIYFVSATILALVYMKFIARRRLSPCLSAVCPRSRMTSPVNPLLGKV